MIYTNTDCICLNNGQPTRLNSPTQQPTTPDLTISSLDLRPYLSWNIFPDNIQSDHFPIIINWTIKSTTPLSISYRKKINQINWELYSSFIEDYIYNNTNIDKIMDNYTYLTNIINKYLNIMHPYIKKKLIQYDKIRPIWWNEECSRIIAIKRLTLKQYKKEMTQENYIKVKKTTTQVRRTIKEVKQKSWINYCQNLNKSSNISDIWKKIKLFTQKKKTHTTEEVDYKWMEDLLHNIITRLCDTKLRNQSQ